MIVDAQRSAQLAQVADAALRMSDHRQQRAQSTARDAKPELWDVTLEGGARVGRIPVLAGHAAGPMQAREPAADPQCLGVVFVDRNAAEFEERDAAGERLGNVPDQSRRGRPHEHDRCRGCRSRWLRRTGNSSGVAAPHR